MTAMPDAETLNRAWEAFLLAPAQLGLVIAAFALGAWLLRGHLAKGQVEALKERLALAKDQLETVKAQLAAADQRAAQQDAVIESLRSSASIPSAQIEQLASGNTTIRNNLHQASHTAVDMGVTLTFTGAGYSALVVPLRKTE